MKVLYVSKALVSAAYRDKLGELDRLVDVAAVVPRRWGAAEPESSPPGLPEPRRVPAVLHGHNHLHLYPGASHWLDAEAPDLVHIDEEPYSLVTLQLARLCRRRRIPCLFFAWQNLRRRLPPPFPWVRSAVFRAVDGGIAGTDAAAGILRAEGYDGPVAVIPQFGVDPERFRPDPGAARRVRTRQGIPPDAFVVGYGGRLVPEKGVDVLVRAFARLPPAPSGTEPWLVVLGDGPDADRLTREAYRVGVGGRTRFLGAVASTRVPEVLAALDVVVLPSVGTHSWAEQFGRILAEAMACGVPVVGSRCGEIPEVIGPAGDLVDRGDPQQLAAALERLLLDRNLRARRRAAGRARVLERFTQARVAERTVAFYEELAGAETGVGT